MKMIVEECCSLIKITVIDIKLNQEFLKGSNISNLNLANTEWPTLIRRTNQTGGSKLNCKLQRTIIDMEQLTYLNLKGCKWVDNNLLINLSRNGSKLIYLNIKNCINVESGRVLLRICICGQNKMAEIL